MEEIASERPAAYDLAQQCVERVFVGVVIACDEAVDFSGAGEGYDFLVIVAVNLVRYE